MSYAIAASSTGLLQGPRSGALGRRRRRQRSSAGRYPSTWGALVGLDIVRVGQISTATARTGRTGTVYFHWYLDGAFAATTVSPTWSVWLPAGDQVEIEVIDTTDPDFDPIANAPTGWSSRRTITWIRSLDDDVAVYQIEQQVDGGGWSKVAEIVRRSETWAYDWLTAPLDDLAAYEWRIRPVDIRGVAGSYLASAVENVVRRPDAPDFTATFDPGTTRVTFAAA